MFGSAEKEKTETVEFFKCRAVGSGFLELVDDDGLPMTINKSYISAVWSVEGGYASLRLRTDDEWETKNKYDDVVALLA